MRFLRLVNMIKYQKHSYKTEVPGFQWYFSHFKQLSALWIHACYQQVIDAHVYLMSFNPYQCLNLAWMTKVSIMLFMRNVLVQCFSAIFPTALCLKVSTTFFRRKNLLQIKIPWKNLDIFSKILLLCTGRIYGQRKHLM